jgi:glutamine amidotransferase
MPMCRLFGLTAGTVRVTATFWLLDAPDSLKIQSRRNADGAGLGYFGPDGAVVLDKQPEPAYSDREFIRAAGQARSSAFVAHVRWATTGGRTARNTHPFGMEGRVMGHNGGIGSLARLDAELGPYRRLVLGETDSERYFALITKQTDAHGGDVAAGITAAASWIGARLPVSSLNVVVAAPRELWALRYPGAHALHLLERPAGAGPGEPGLHVRDSTSSVHAPGLADAASVVVASEAMDGESGWRMLEPGELVHVRPDLSVESRIAVPEGPAHLVPLPAGNPNIDT